MTRFYQFLLRKRDEFYLGKYYQSIDELPMWNWVRVYEQKDYRYLLKKGKKVDRFADVAYLKMQDELVDQHGVGDLFLKILRMKIKISLMQADQVLSGDRTSEIKVKILEDKIKEMEVGFKDVNIFQTVISLEKVMGFKMDLKTLTVGEFYKYAKFVSKQG